MSGPGEKEFPFQFRPIDYLPFDKRITWINRNGRLWKEAEAAIESATDFLYAAAVMILIRRIAHHL
jgi:hypothetical protein